MSSYPPSNRFSFDTAQLRAALALADITVHPRSPLALLKPDAQSSSLPQGTPLLDATGRGLAPHIATMLQVVAAPGRMISCRLNLAGEPEWTEKLLFHVEAGKGPFVSFKKLENGFEFI